MSKYELEVVVDGFHYLEGPRWYKNALWFVDFYTKGFIASMMKALQKRLCM